MSRLYTRTFIFTFVFLYLSVGLEARTEKYRCMWRQDPATSLVIGWNQVSGQNPVLLYGTDDYGTDASLYPYQETPARAVIAKGMNNQFVRLNGLLPNTTYYFVIVDSEGSSARMSFTTLPNDPHQRLSIIAGGDSRNFREARQKANQMVGKLRPHFVMFGGDMTGGDNATQWRAWMDDWQLTMSSEGRLTPIVVTRGNHEYSNQTLIDLFDVAHERIYYGLTFGGNLLRAYTLNSLISVSGKQRDWLENDLKKHEHIRWKMAQYHFAIRPHTRRKSEQNDQLMHWASLFHQHNVNLVVESDAHCVKTTFPVRPSREAGSDEGFIRDDENGTVYIGEGCWGAPLRRNDDDKKWTRNSGSFNQFKWIFVDWEKIEVRTVKTDNADMVDHVQPENVFFPPNGLDIWQPSNGPVIYIRAEENRAAAQPVFAANSIYMQVSEFKAIRTGNFIELAWLARNEPRQRIFYELQRSVDGGKKFTTIAHINGQGQMEAKYRITDYSTHLKGVDNLQYRLSHNFLNGMPRHFLASPLADDCPDMGDASSPTTIQADPQTGLVQVKYELEECSDVCIRLLDNSKNDVSRSEYPNQRPGNFLKSIDMRSYPKGAYWLVIEADQKVIKKLAIQRG